MAGEPSALPLSVPALMSPLSAKLLLRALNENLARYEAAFGEISVPSSTLAEQLFKPLSPPDEGKP